MWLTFFCKESKHLFSITLIKINSKCIYNVTEDLFIINAVLLNFLFI